MLLLCALALCSIVFLLQPALLWVFHAASSTRLKCDGLLVVFDVFFLSTSSPPVLFDCSIKRVEIDRSGLVYGCFGVEVRVCACPVRDRKAMEDRVNVSVHYHLRQPERRAYGIALLETALFTFVLCKHR